MFEDNKLMIITGGIIAVSIIALFGLLIAFAPSGEIDPTLLVREDSYVEGNTSAEITLVAFEDFQCPACAQTQPLLEQVKEEYGDRLKFVYRHFPLNNIHPFANIAALASESAGGQGKFYEYHDVLYAKQNEWAQLPEEELVAKFVEYAKEVEIANIDQFKSDIENKTYQSKIDRDVKDGTELKIEGTPTLYINGKLVKGRTLEAFKKIIDEEIGQ